MQESDASADDEEVPVRLRSVGRSASLVDVATKAEIPNVVLTQRSPESSRSDDDEAGRAARGESAPSRPKPSLHPDREEVARGESAPSRPMPLQEFPGRGEHVPSGLLCLLEELPAAKNQYMPLTANLGVQRKRPKAIWHYFVGLHQESPLLPSKQNAASPDGESFSPMLNYGSNRAAGHCL